jgi:hypothetical protein
LAELQKIDGVKHLIRCKKSSRSSGSSPGCSQAWLYFSIVKYEEKDLDAWLDENLKGLILR